MRLSSWRTKALEGFGIELGVRLVEMGLVQCDRHCPSRKWDYPALDLEAYGGPGGASIAEQRVIEAVRVNSAAGSFRARGS